MQKLHPLAVLVTCALSLAGCATAPPQEAKLDHAAPRAAAARPPLTAEAMYRLGRYYEGQSRFEKAIAAYREALKRDPLLVEAYTGLGMALAAERRYDEAIRELQAAAVLAPYAAQVHNNLGYAYLLSGAYHQALEALERARQLDPAHEKANGNLRLAQAKLAPEPRTEAAARLTLVEIGPQVFELRDAVKYRRIEARPLPRSFRLEVSNGNGVRGMARRVATQLAQHGVLVARVSNAPTFREQATVVHYRAGHEAEAIELAARVPNARTARNDALPARIDLRLVLGRNNATLIALAD